MENTRWYMRRDLPSCVANPFILCFVTLSNV